MKRTTMTLALAALTLTQAAAQLTLHQRKTDAQHLRLSITNSSAQTIGRDWHVYFSVLPTDAASESPEVSVSCINGNFFRLSPTEAWHPLAAGETVELNLRLPGVLNKTSQLPEGYFYVGADGQPRSLTYTNAPFDDRELTVGVKEAFESNKQLPSPAELAVADVLPSVKQWTATKGTCRMGKGFTLHTSAGTETEGRLLREKLTGVLGLTESPRGTAIRLSIAREAGQADEHYRLSVTPRGIDIVGTTAHGVFNGTQTLLQLLRTTQGTVPCLTIDDEPDLGYRGVMIDIARNFTTYDDLLRLLDLLAQYKLDALHFHVADDEGWRVEIAGLPELTEVGGHRGYTLDEQTCLYPGYDGHWDASAPTSGNGYLTRQQFVSLLRYAAERHIRVMPEIESPGHARAAVVAMKARYNRYHLTDPQKATEYLLSDPADTSVYKSVQAYTDNVMNIALPSTYAFMRKVIDEISAMYCEAGVPFEVLHLGGDEVAEGCWTGSPVCRKFMEEQGLSTREELSSHFYAAIIHYLDTLGVRYGGWQEIASAHRPLNTDYFRSRAGAVNCWTTVPEWGTDELTYQLANEGYPVLLSNVTNCYMDMTYSRHPDERGLQWGGTVSEATSFSLLPFDGYRSVHTTVNGRPIDWTHRPAGKTALTDTGRQHILGVQGQLFAETVRGVDNVEYCFFPKVLGLLERGWHAHPTWEQVEGPEAEQRYQAELATFYAKLSLHEMPYWQQLGIHFHLPNPGLAISGGTLYANTPVTGATIRYTTDGSDPTPQSPLYTQPVPLGGGVSIVKARLFAHGRQSVVSAALP